MLSANLSFQKEWICAILNSAIFLSFQFVLFMYVSPSPGFH